MRLGKVKPAQGPWSMGTGQRILLQSGRAEEPDVLCQGEVDSFWGKGPLPIPRAETGERLQRVRLDLGKPEV